jgi:hypothetical protein
MGHLQQRNRRRGLRFQTRAEVAWPVGTTLADESTKGAAMAQSVDGGVSTKFVKNAAMLLLAHAQTGSATRANSVALHR